MSAAFYYTELPHLALQRKDFDLGRVMRHIGHIEQHLWGDLLKVVGKNYYKPSHSLAAPMIKIIYWKLYLYFVLASCLFGLVQELYYL